MQAGGGTRTPCLEAPTDGCNDAAVAAPRGVAAPAAAAAADVLQAAFCAADRADGDSGGVRSVRSVKAWPPKSATLLSTYKSGNGTKALSTASCFMWDSQIKMCGAGVWGAHLFSV